MLSARLTDQLVANIPARVGILADVAQALHEAGVNISAISAYERDGIGKFLLVTDDNEKAKAALARLNADVHDRSVLVLQMHDKPGALEDATTKIAEAGINIDYCYGTANGGGTATVVFKTADNPAAANLF